MIEGLLSKTAASVADRVYIRKYAKLMPSIMAPAKKYFSYLQLAEKVLFGLSLSFRPKPRPVFLKNYGLPFSRG